MTMKIEGLIVPAITPRINSSVDSTSLISLLEFLIDGKVDAIFILGTTGEFQHLSLDEKKQVIKTSTDCIRDRVPILVGISSESIDETLALMDTAEDCKAQALVLAPMFGKSNPLEQLRRVLDLSHLPIVLYNNPAIHRNVNLPPTIIEKFIYHPRVIGIKDSSSEWDYFQELLALKSPDFCVIQGKEAMILPSLEAGAGGIVAGVANIIPEMCTQLWIQRDQQTMDRIMAVKSEVKRDFPNSVSGYKHRLVQLGIIKSAELFLDCLRR